MLLNPSKCHPKRSLLIEAEWFDVAVSGWANQATDQHACRQPQTLTNTFYRYQGNCYQHNWIYFTQAFNRLEITNIDNAEVRTNRWGSSLSVGVHTYKEYGFFIAGLTPLAIVEFKASRHEIQTFDFAMPLKESLTLENPKGVTVAISGNSQAGIKINGAGYDAGDFNWVGNDSSIELIDLGGGSSGNLA